ncbi:MAG: putative Ig domain-containing protein, partial [Planctomycetota bacterium]|nr:putative Ig domain-containing protein [Planctomycetota bacterium]
SGTGYNQSIATVGGTGAKTISVASGTLPAGLNLVGSTIAGTPSAAGTSVFVLRATDTVGAFDEQAYSITINSTLSITTATLANWTISKSGYSQTIATTGGTGASTFAVTVGTLPNGLTLNPNTGVLSGTPTVARW